MCGRFVGYQSLEDLRAYFPIDHTACEAVANYNIAPTQKILAIAIQGNAHVLDQYHWGLVPSWAKDVSIGRRMINARSETVAEKPSFRSAFRKRRCLIPADGFYEWIDHKGNRQPVYLTLPEQRPFGFAGLWEQWQNPQQPDMPYRSCTILTAPATGTMRTIHHRMPLIVQPQSYEQWLGPAAIDANQLAAMVAANPAATCTATAVSSKVNSVRHNAATNIAPHRQLKLDF